jgi:hypothetical protein
VFSLQNLFIMSACKLAPKPLLLLLGKPGLPLAGWVPAAKAALLLEGWKSFEPLKT